MSWRRVEIAGRAADVFEPTTVAAFGGAVLFLHGHGGETLADKPAYTAELERHGLRCVCPHGGRGWWLDVPAPDLDADITPLRFLVDRVLPWIAETWHVQPPMIGLLGVSMGGQGVLQLAYRHPLRFPVVAAVSPVVDFHRVYGEGLPLDAMFPDREAVRQETVVLQLHGLNWPRHQLITCDPADAHWFEGAERLAMKLASSGVPFERDFETSAGGHTWYYFNPRAPRVVGFIAERLEKESRRVP
jgi:S-formylglutathione hydrolase